MPVKRKLVLLLQMKDSLWLGLLGGTLCSTVHNSYLNVSPYFFLLNLFIFIVSCLWYAQCRVPNRVLKVLMVSWAQNYALN